MSIAIGMRTLLEFLTIALLVVTCLGCGGKPKSSGGNGTGGEAAQAVTNFAAAVAKEAEQEAASVCTEEFWNDRDDAGKHFYEQATRKKFEFRQTNARTRDKRAVITCEILRDGRRVDEVFFYVVDYGGWKIDGWDENKAHPGLFLEEKLPARFRVNSYPSSPELEKLGKSLIRLAPRLHQLAGKNSEQRQVLEGVLANPKNVNLKMLADLHATKPTVTGTHLISSLQRGAISIKDERNQKVFLYVEKHDDGWKLLECSSGWLSAESLLR